MRHAAGLDLGADLKALDNATRIKADPAAVRYLANNITFDGQLDIPVLTMHTTGDGLVVPENEQAHSSVADKAGDARLLRQVFVHRAGHCAFTPAETITAAQDLLHRLRAGRWGAGRDRPGRPEHRRRGAERYLSRVRFRQPVGRHPPAFLCYEPAPYLRTFDVPGTAEGR